MGHRIQMASARSVAAITPNETGRFTGAASTLVQLLLLSWQTSIPRPPRSRVADGAQRRGDWPCHGLSTGVAPAMTCVLSTGERVAGHCRDRVPGPTDARWSRAASAHQPRRWLGRGTVRSGLVCPARLGWRRRGRPRPGSSRSGLRCRCTGAAPRRCARPSSGSGLVDDQDTVGFAEVPNHLVGQRQFSHAFTRAVAAPEHAPTRPGAMIPSRARHSPANQLAVLSNVPGS